MTLDAAAVLKRRNYFTSNWQDDSQVKWLQDTGIELIRAARAIDSDVEVIEERASLRHEGQVVP